MMQKSKNIKRRVLVTGASKGIGQAIAIRLGADGFDVVVHYHKDAQGAQTTVEHIKGQNGCAHVMGFDAGNRQASRVAIEADIAAHGAYYGVVSNAGITRDAAFPAMSEADWDGVINTNLNSFYNVIHPCVMPMIGLRAGGRVVTMSSVSGLMGNRGQTNYSAAKAGVIGASKALALELAKRRITVNCVAPGLIETDILQMEPVVLDEIMGMIPLRRMGQPNEVAGLVSYLMSDEAAYVTRQVISINGGML